MISLLIFLLIRGTVSTITSQPNDIAKDSFNGWTWKCIDGNCVKSEPTEGENNICFHVCQLTCAHGTLWPLPTGEINISKTVVAINPKDITLKFTASNKGNVVDNEEVLFGPAGMIFKDKVASKIKPNQPNNSKNKLFVNVVLDNMAQKSFVQNTNEGYSLQVSLLPNGNVNATIEADNFFGGRHGLETLSQLIVFDFVNDIMVIPDNARISDSPQYGYRGLMLDTARSYISVPALKRTINGMSINKLNTFHWHITDSHSFPFKSSSFPLLTKYGAYSSSKIYSEEDIKSIIEYARVRGIRVIAEFDAPAHVGEGWQWVGDNATVCFKAEPWNNYCAEPPCGQLNPTSEKMYEVLGGIYKDLLKVFEADLFHMGGDEVNLACWNSSDSLVKKMSEMNLGRESEDFHKLWSIFQNRAKKIVDDLRDDIKDIILWTSSLTSGNIENYLDKSKYIIQIWTKGSNNQVADLIKKGYRVIFSNYDALYFDCGFGSWIGNGNNWCSPYIPWQKVYQNRPEQILQKLGVDSEDNRKLVLGSAAALWTEQADDTTIDMKLWPRAAAMAESTWSKPGHWKKAANRFLYQRERMVEQGLQPDTYQPKWCIQNQGACHDVVI